MIQINGICFENITGGNITIRNGKVFVDGEEVKVGDENTKFKDVYITGDVRNIKCAGSVHITGNVKGDIDCGGSCHCGNVGGSVDAGGSVVCGTVGGDVDAGGSVKIGK
jgi:cytoskeletal protein CcmA (bactofilin family)